MRDGAYWRPDVMNDPCVSRGLGFQLASVTGRYSFVIRAVAGYIDVSAMRRNQQDDASRAISVEFRKERAWDLRN